MNYGLRLWEPVTNIPLVIFTLTKVLLFWNIIRRSFWLDQVDGRCDKYWSIQVQEYKTLQKC